MNLPGTVLLGVAILAGPLAFAGCAGTTVDERGADLGAGRPVPAAHDAIRFTGDTGGISGTVVDDSVFPLMGVEVFLDRDVVTTTDKGGRFAFSEVPSGRHELVATKPAYFDHELALEIPAGEITSVTIVLVPTASNRPYHETRQTTGFVACAVGSRSSANVTSFVNACGLFFVVGQGLEQFDRSGLDWPVGPIDDAKVGFWAETAWTPSQTLGRGMVVRWYVQNLPWNGAAASGQADRYKSSPDIAVPRGHSPIAARIPVEALDVNASAGDGKVCQPGADCFLRSFHYPYAEPSPVAGAPSYSIYVNQRFDDYLTLFYNGVLPDQFSVLV